MDECIGSVMPLYYFVESIDMAKMLEVADALIVSEERGATWCIRPALREVLLLVGRAYFAKQIQGAFILSNNSSELLVNFIAVLLNRWIRYLFQLAEDPLVFVMGISASSSVRLALGAEMNYVKSFDVVQHCLGSYGFPPCSTPSDLLFFDDQPHVLAGEIPHYCRVRAYHNQTPVWRIQEVLGAFVPSSAAAEAAHLMEEREASRRIGRLLATAPSEPTATTATTVQLPFARALVPTPATIVSIPIELPFRATAEETAGDTRVMMAAFLKFLAPRGGRRAFSMRSTKRKLRKRRLT